MINQNRQEPLTRFHIIAITAIVFCMVIICLMSGAIIYLVNNQQALKAMQQKNNVNPCPTCAAIVDPAALMPALTAPPVSAPASAPPSPAPATPAVPPDFTNVKKFNGSGNLTTEMFDLKTGTVKIEWKYTGGGNFIIQLISARDGTVENIVNANGASEDQKIFFLDKDNPYVIDVTSSGNWDISVDWMP